MRKTIYLIICALSLILLIAFGGETNMHPLLQFAFICAFGALTFIFFKLAEEA